MGRDLTGVQGKANYENTGVHVLEAEVCVCVLGFVHCGVLFYVERAEQPNTKPSLVGTRGHDTARV